MAGDGGRLLKIQSSELAMMGLMDALVPLQSRGRTAVREGSATSVVHLRMKATDLLEKHQDKSGSVKKRHVVFE